MAQSQPSNTAVLQQQARQQGLTTLLSASLLSAWALIDLTDLAGSLPKYEAAVAALVYKYGQASAAMATHFYRTQRDLAGIRGTFKPVAADPPGIEQVQKSLGWATRGLWAPPEAVTKVPERPPVAAEAPKPIEPPEAVTNAQTLAQGVAQKMVVGTGRNTLIEAIEADKECRGWARQARPTGCSFCALLSTRGAVYHSEETASFEAHDHCHCIPVPVYADHYEPPAYVRQWQQLYTDSTRGKSNADARNAFRVELEKHRNPAPIPALV